MVSYKVCILAAGKGSRMGGFCNTFNKALLPMHGKPAICHIIDKFQIDIEIVIALGYKKDTIMVFLDYNYPNRKITYVEVDNWEGPGSGPGYSLLCCKDQLQTPFIQFATDTLVANDIPRPTSNWIGIAPVSTTKRFCTVKLSGNSVLTIDDKKESDNRYAYIGLFGVKDYKYFWTNLKNKSDDLIDNEFQVSNGLSSLIKKKLHVKSFKWFDLGTIDAYKHAINNYPNGDPYMG